MKKLLLLAFLGFTMAVSAQNELSVALTAPTANANVGAGIPFKYEAVLTNNGSTAISSSDTILNLPVVNGSTIQGLFFLRNFDIPAGGSVTLTEWLNLIGGTTGPLQLCSYVLVLGNSESDSTDNIACETVMWDNALSTGDFEIAVIANNSFYANGTYNVELEKAFGMNTATVSFINLNGQTILTESFDINAGSVNGQINVEGLAKGLYIVSFISETGEIGSDKVMIQ